MSFLEQFACAGLANMIAAAVTNPIDVVKVRLQIDGTGKSGEARRFTSSPLDAGAKIVRAEGVGALYRGLLASLVREGSYSGIRMGMYEPVKQALGATDPDHTPFYLKVGAGALTGALGSALANPLDLLKVQMQSVEGPSGPHHPTTSARLRTAMTEYGILGLWRGSIPTITRAALLTATQIPSYDHAKHTLMNMGFADGIGLHFVCSTFAGVCTAVVTAPVDLAKTRIMNHSSEHGMVRTILEVARVEGVPAIYKGFHGQWLRIGPHTTVSLMVFENLRHLFGMDYL